MKLFSCNACGHTLHFDNVTCNQCGHRLGFVPETLELVAFDEHWRPVTTSGPAEPLRPCANYSNYQACNWMAPLAEGSGFCISCRLNRTIPDLSSGNNLALWRRLQGEKHRLIYGLLRLRLPLANKLDAPETGLAFDVVQAPLPRLGEDSAGITGHFRGVITLDIAEANAAVREHNRQEMAEPYRTVLGHLRHESGHYYWEHLVRDAGRQSDYRQLFGDERTDYRQALAQHYAWGAPADWPERFVSAYASSHPWEDWAETWAHYLHITDTLETAWQFGLRLDPQVEESADLSANTIQDPYEAADFRALIAHWLPLTVALNSLNRSMGQPDAYPFVLSASVIEKLAWVHQRIREAACGLDKPR